MTRPTRLRRTVDQVNVMLDDSIVIMKLADSSYFELNAVGVRIWELLEQPADAEALVATLLTEYDVDEQTCRDEVQAWLSKMQEFGLVETAE